jgi:hypothetical protein
VIGVALYVVGDVHGFLTQATDALREAGLIDDDDAWSGGDAQLWFLGDLTDRGPNGIGVIDLVRRLQEEAAAVGGEVGCVLGNHDMLLYGSKFVPDSPVSEQRSVIQVWALNGGVDRDLSKLDHSRARWLANLPAVALVDDHLLIHADTLAYLEFGKTITEINTTFHDLMARPEHETFGYQARQLFRRFDFLDSDAGVSNAQLMLKRLGGTRIVHGHSTIPETFGVAPSTVDAPVVYADGLVLAADTGLALGAKCVPIELPLKDEVKQNEEDEVTASE